MAFGQSWSHSKVRNFKTRQRGTQGNAFWSCPSLARQARVASNGRSYDQGPKTKSTSALVAQTAHAITCVARHWDFLHGCKGKNVCRDKSHTSTFQHAFGNPANLIPKTSRRVAGVERSEPPGKRQLDPTAVFSVGRWRSNFRWGLAPLDPSHPPVLHVLNLMPMGVGGCPPTKFWGLFHFRTQLPRVLLNLRAKTRDDIIHNGTSTGDSLGGIPPNPPRLSAETIKSTDRKRRGSSDELGDQINKPHVLGVRIEQHLCDVLEFTDWRNERDQDSS